MNLNVNRMAKRNGCANIKGKITFSFWRWKHFNVFPCPFISIFPQEEVITLKSTLGYNIIFSNPTDEQALRQKDKDNAQKLDWILISQVQRNCSRYGLFCWWKGLFAIDLCGTEHVLKLAGGRIPWQLIFQDPISSSCQLRICFPKWPAPEI